MITDPRNIELVLRWLKWVSKLNTISSEAPKKARITVSAPEGSTSSLPLLFGDQEGRDISSHFV